jgi:asparagine synthetase B (glutamine-hydrolysing)
MARGVSQERLRAAREVVSLLRRDPSFRESVAVNEAGDRPIVVATLDERMDDLLRRVVAAGPPPVTVCFFRSGGSRSMVLATMHPNEPADGRSAESVPVEPSVTVAMFLAWAWQMGTATFHLEKCRELAADYEAEFA